MDYQNIIFKVEDNIGQLIVNRPEARNALNRAARLEMADVLAKVQADPSIKVLVVSGAGEKAFVAGSDVKELAQYSPLDMEHFMDTLAQGFYSRFERLDRPVIAMIDGLCLGGGLEFALACDLRFASDRSLLGLPEIRLGIMPGGGGTQRLPRLVGVAKTKELIFTGEFIKADEAERLGIVNRVFPAEELEEQVMAVAKKITAKSSLALKWAKKAINASQETGLRAGLDYEAMVECLLFTSEDRHEGIKALFEKREPKFQGK
ncbi:enoyl-CoA hydratase/isomerase family protein [Desulfoferula mesophila]|uniref:Crotonase n=1 Tax=Desulfoferula mesophila TaxID=3058419 RepID=A0AAU9ECJ3_9BACT|nr:crotonase [Desulfoferula mesophilus]